jgi:hypothetical protein
MQATGCKRGRDKLDCHFTIGAEAEPESWTSLTAARY